MIRTNKNNIKTMLEDDGAIYFYGICEIAEYSLIGMNLLGNKINGIFDSSIELSNNKTFNSNIALSNNEKFKDIPILGTNELSHIDKSSHIIITCSHFIIIERYLNTLGFHNVYEHCFLIERVINEKILKGNYNRRNKQGNYRTEAKRFLVASQEYVKHAIRQFDGKIVIPSIDVIITEKCSLACADCANLMPYFKEPKNVDFEVICSSLEKISSVCDSISELRILGGEPFIIKDIDKIINYCTGKIKVADRVVIYTNATILPQPNAIKAMKHKNVFVEITDYGELSKALDKTTAIYDQEGILYSVEQLPDSWDDSADIIHPKRSIEENQYIFDSCCAKYLYTLMHGKLYRCPFSASLNYIDTNLGNANDYVDCTLDDESLKMRLESFIYSPRYIPSCEYCRGRSTTLGRTKAARQTRKKREPFEVIVEYD